MFHSKIPRFQDSRVPRFQILRGGFNCSIQFLWPSWFQKGITHVANRWNQFVPFQDSKIPGFQDSKFLGGDSIVPFNFCDLPDSKKVSHMVVPSISDFCTTSDPTYPAVKPCKGHPCHPWHGSPHPISPSSVSKTRVDKYGWILRKRWWACPVSVCTSLLVFIETLQPVNSR